MMSRKVIPFRRELPPDPLAGCRLMVDPERSPRRTGPGVFTEQNTPCGAVSAGRSAT